MRWLVGALVLLIGCVSPALAQRTIFVDALAAGQSTGANWANAYTSLQAALDESLQGDTLRTRGTFYETAIVRTEGVTILGDTSPGRPTWIRGDRYASPASWQWTGTQSVYALDGIAQLIGTTIRPGGVVYDYKRDDLTGTVTGIDLTRFYSELPANGAGVYYGHLRHATDLADLALTPSSWWWDQASDRVYVHAPAGVAFDPAKAGVCINTQNGLTLLASDVLVSGVNTLCTPGFAQNNGYGMKGMATITGTTVENADIIDPGWHAAGFEVGAPSHCTLRNIRAWSSGVDGSNASNPFVFYTSQHLPNAGHLGEDLTFHAYPLLGTDGAPIFRSFYPKLGLSHATTNNSVRLGGITWQRCHLVDHVTPLEARHGPITSGGTGISAGNVPAFTPGVASTYPIVVQDSVFEGVGAAPDINILYERCRFIAGTSQLDAQYRSNITGPIWLRACTIEVGSAGEGGASAYFNITNKGRLTLELCTLHAESGTPVGAFFRTAYGVIDARQSVFSSRTPMSLVLIWPDAWRFFQLTKRFTQCYYAGPLTPAAHPWSAPRTWDWWVMHIDRQARVMPSASFIDPDGTNLRPLAGSDLHVARSTLALPSLLGLTDLDGRPYTRSYGASQRPCAADVNRDGFSTPADFSAWIAAFNTQSPAADVNADGSITPADFSAWIAAFNAGC